MAMRSLMTALWLALPAAAQLGRPTGLRIDVQRLTGNAGCVGVCRSVDGGGSVRLWVSARAPQATSDSAASSANRGANMAPV